MPTTSGQGSDAYIMTAEELRARRKLLAFDALYALGEDSDGEGDPGLLASLEALRGKTIGDPTIPTPISKRTSSLSRSLSTPFPPHTAQPSNPKRASALQLLEDAEAVKETPVPSLRKSASVDSLEAMQNSSASMPPTFANPRALGKRKRNYDVIEETPLPQLRKSATMAGTDIVQDSFVPSSSAIPRAIGAAGKKKGNAEMKLANIKLVPQDQRVFSGLHFYFFPNDDMNQGRRKRIIKAMEYGATWQKDWNASVTHIIVDIDDNMKWPSVIKHLSTKGGLGSQELPSHVVVVNEAYPARCIDFHLLVDPTQKQYVVQGYVAPASHVMSAIPPPTNISTGPSQVSDESLQLKPPGKSVRAREPTTPSRSEETPNSSTNHGDVQSDSFPTVPQEKSEGDDLDAATWEIIQADCLAIGDETVTNLNTHAWQKKFQCMSKHTGKDAGPNDRTISLLQELAEYYTETRDTWRPKAYRSAIAALRNHPSRITTKAEALKLNGIGESIADKIEEICVTNQLRKLDYAKLDPRQRILQIFTKIYGVGFSAAQQFVNMGYRTLDDVVKNAPLTRNQRLGIEHYDHFNARIPRNEVKKHADIVRTTLRGLDPSYQAFCMGSYRRGADTSGDIDMLITKPGVPISEIREMVIEKLVPMLTKSGFLVASLAETSAEGSKWHGASCIPGAHIWRRIDFLLVPEEELGAAMIYFTGNDIFNRSLRLLASKKKMRLNQRGLYNDVIRDAGREKLSEGILIEGRDEKKIFEALGVPWRPPEHRIC